jgi:hypothetical protein
MAAPIGNNNKNLAMIGKYRWTPSEDQIEFYRRHHLTPPDQTIQIGDKGIFHFFSSDGTTTDATLGTYEFDGDTVAFHVEGGPGTGLPVRMKLSDSGLTTPGTTYVRTTEDPNPNNGIPSLTQTFSVYGKWKMCKLHGGIESSIAYRFMPDSTWTFQGMGVKSSGIYLVTDYGIEIFYLEIDGQSIDPKANMHKTIAFVDAKKAFVIDQYRFEKE